MSEVFDEKALMERIDGDLEFLEEIVRICCARFKKPQYRVMPTRPLDRPTHSREC